MMMEDED
jgi:hypothetical protein